MRIINFDLSMKDLFWGNILLIVCCGFYLAWWLLAFRPEDAIKGMKSGWLLIPAALAGFIAVAWIVQGVTAAPAMRELFPGKWLIWGGIAAYIILLVITRLVFKRPVTSELLLIVGWAVLALSEINALYGMHGFSRGTALTFAVVIAAALVLCLVCYVLYYRLDSRMAYWDGMVPLLLAALVMAGISVVMAVE